MAQALTADFAEAEALWSDQFRGCGGAAWRQLHFAVRYICWTASRPASEQMKACDSTPLGSAVYAICMWLYDPMAARAQHAADAEMKCDVDEVR